MTDFAGGPNADIAPLPDNVGIATGRTDLTDQFLASNVRAATKARLLEAGVVGVRRRAGNRIASGKVHTGRRVSRGTAGRVDFTHHVQALPVCATRHSARVEAKVLRFGQLTHPQRLVDAGRIVADVATLGTQGAHGRLADGTVAARAFEGIGLEAAVGLVWPPVGALIEMFRGDGNARAVPLPGAAKVVHLAHKGGAIRIGTTRRLDVLEACVQPGPAFPKHPDSKTSINGKNRPVRSLNFPTGESSRQREQRHILT